MANFYVIYRLANGTVDHWVIGDSAERADKSRLRRLGEDADDYAVLASNVDCSDVQIKVDVTADPPVIVPFTPTKTPDEIKAEILRAAQARLDTFAQTRGYDSILSAATYATSTVEQFAAEGQRAVELRDLTWAALYQMLAEVQAGARAMPASYADIESELPALTWPEV